MTFDERVGKLERFTVYGPGYNRNVTGNLADARRFEGRGEPMFAEIFLRRAEAQAHFADTGEWVAPTPVAKGLS